METVISATSTADRMNEKVVPCSWQDGEHQCEDNVPKYTDAQLKLMKSQDIRYVNFKRSLELKARYMCQFV